MLSNESQRIAKQLVCMYAEMTSVNNTTNNTNNTTSTTSTNSNDNASSESISTVKANISKIKGKMAEAREKMADKREHFLSGLASFFAGQADKINDIFQKVVEKRIDFMQKHNDDGDYTEALAKEQEKLTKLQGAGQFWKTEKVFWDYEAKTDYPPESHEQVEDYYHQIASLERKFANITLGWSHDDPAAVTQQIDAIRLKLAQLGGKMQI